MRIIAVLMLVVGQVSVYACVGPENVFGIQFNNGESIDAGVIENLGEKDVSYFKKEQNGLLTYSFRSHYNQSIMVEVITHTDPAVLSATLNFTVDTSTFKMTKFPFGPCVRAELDWLADAGVIAMDRLKRERIEKSFNESIDSLLPASYFWTEQDSLIPNNWTFHEDGSIVAPSIRCGPVDFTVADLPSQTIAVVVAIANRNTRLFSGGYAAVAGPDRSAMLFIDIRGRMHRPQGGAVSMSHRPGVLFGFDYRSGMVKRVVALP